MAPKTKTAKTTCSSCWAEVVINYHDPLATLYPGAEVFVRGTEVDAGFIDETGLIIWDCTCGYADSFDVYYQED